MRSFLISIATLSLGLASVSAAKLPAKIYGVNLGSWLLIEPWMLPAEWVSMGGQINCDCSKCIGSEFALVQSNPGTADQKFQKHWDSWFTQADVTRLQSLGINTVRIPLGYWIVEDLVDRNTEFYPKGGLAALRRGLQQLANAGIVAILDHHAPPGVQATNQQFAGRCTTDLKFYTDSNYHRALVWTAVMTALSHADSTFSNVASIEAVNEIEMDANKTPGYGTFQKNFVSTVRAVEQLLGIPVPGLSSNFKADINRNITVSLGQFANLPPTFNQEVKNAVADARPILAKLGIQIGQLFDFQGAADQTSLTTSFMDINWQYNNPPNPASAAIGPQLYDNHLYYSFGGVADANENAYLTHVCNLNRIQVDAGLGNTPLVFGGMCYIADPKTFVLNINLEWALTTQFSASDAFLKKWADAQKLNYGKGAGWIFWNFKLEKSSQAGDSARQWSYFEGVDRGYLTKDPSKFNDPHVCDAYIKH